MPIEEISTESVDSNYFLPLEEPTKEESVPSSYPEASDSVRAELLQMVMALPPWIQTEIEKSAILKDPRLKELLGDESVVDIVKAEGGYQVLTENHSLDVHVKYLPMDYCGPAEFELEFGAVSPLK